MGIEKKKLVVLGSALMIAVGSATVAWSAEAKAGKATYDKLCASCHGPDGKGNPGMVKAMGEKGLNLLAKESQGKKDEVWLKAIVEGAGKMPAAGKNLSQQEQKDVLGYTRSLGK